MNISRMAGCCLILLGIINILHEINLTGTGRGQPGVAYAIITAALFTFGIALLLRSRRERTTK
jgi:membrane-bound ClpP family serine protease